MVHIHTMDYYSAKERTKFESAAVSWKNGEPVTQSEVNYKQKNKYSILMNIDGIQKSSTDESITEKNGDADGENILVNPAGDGECRTN